ncbi:orotate phosphoribosyltransferase [Lyngbya confervoides]|uniref:Orotate phosphoribosyltransferase n=1 Tax=Lyngbya confervoides BDU141951 TaxID=1574623 RepID=A0ABD4T2U0_9CYAN|nr:orotate phosphoribosyltransferase [Lyngbya confervoides]MCM1982925.1 orotate phosphoribosyltransferase [Lyngbya confervoides BDU141951]
MTHSRNAECIDAELNAGAVPPETDLRQTLLDLLVQHAYQEGNFTLSSGQSSSYYINGKVVTLHPEGALALGHLLLHRLPREVDAIAGLTLGADPIVSAVSIVSALQKRPIPGIIIRKQAKGHGTMAYLEGPSLPPNSTVVVVEDVVTTGQSALMAIERLRQAGYQANRVLAMVDRQQGGAEFYQQQGIEFESIFTIADLQAAYAARSGQS